MAGAAAAPASAPPVTDDRTTAACTVARLDVPADVVVVRRVEAAVACEAEAVLVVPAIVCVPARYGAGSTAVPPRRTSKCTCGPVQLPVHPT